MDEEAEQKGDPFDEVRAALDCGSLGRAEKLLKEMQEHNAEWYYLLSVLFRKKYWFLESKKSLEKAIERDPQNEEYQNAMKELEDRIREEEENRKQIEKATPKDKNFMRDCWCTICDVLSDGCGGC